LRKVYRQVLLREIIEIIRNSSYYRNKPEIVAAVFIMFSSEVFQIIEYFPHFQCKCPIGGRILILVGLSTERNNSGSSKKSQIFIVLMLGRHLQGADGHHCEGGEKIQSPPHQGSEGGVIIS
jgi:hypothetical protein